MTTQHNAPKLESTIARAGIIGIATLSAWIHWHFWADARGDQVSAWLTVAAQGVALGGFAMMLHHGKTALGAGAAIVTALAALWCAATMAEKLNDEAHARAIATVEASAAFTAAQSDLEFARGQLRTVQTRQAPADMGPQTRLAWGENQRAEIRMLIEERDAAQARIDSLAPAPTIDMIAVLRGIGIQIAELIGLAVFGLGIAPRRAATIEPEITAEEKPAAVVDMKAAAAALGKRSGEARRNRGVRTSNA